MEIDKPGDTNPENFDPRNTCPNNDLRELLYAALRPNKARMLRAHISPDANDNSEFPEVDEIYRTPRVMSRKPGEYKPIIKEKLVIYPKEFYFYSS